MCAAPVARVAGCLGRGDAMMKEDVSQVKVALWVRVEDSEIFAQPPSIEKINIVAAKLSR